MKTPLIFRCIFVALLMVVQVTTTYAQEIDRAALTDLYNAAGGANWANTWDQQQPIRTWYGVTVNAQGRVTELDLSSNNLVGTLPYMNLPFLRRLNLSGNRLSGVVPPMTIDAAGNIIPLQLFNINENEFTFEDIAKNYEVNSAIQQGFIYQRQYYGQARAYPVALGDNVTLSADYNGQLGAPEYVWLQRNSQPLTTDSIYTIDNAESEDIGRYYVEIRDSEQFPGDIVMTSYDQIVYNFTSNDGSPVDSEGAPVRPNELILNLELLTPTQLAIINDPTKVKIIDRCDCDDDLILIEILDDSVYEELIDINSRTESADGDNDEEEVENNDNNYDIKLRSEIPVDIWELTFSPAPQPKNRVKVAVIDTGYDGHPQIAPYIPNAQPYTDACVFGANFVDNNNDLSTTNAHGNHIASLAVMDAPPNAISLFPIKAFNDDGKATLFDLICGIHYALDRNVNIINISASYWGEKSDLLEAAVVRAKKERVLIVASSGNGIEGQGVDIGTTPFYPAALPQNNLVVVGSIRPNPFSSFLGDDLSKFSNYSSEHVDIVAYGECIKAAGINNHTTTLGGTSQSTALVTRALALQLAQGTAASLEELVKSLPTKPVTALNGKIKSAQKLDNVQQKLVPWALYVLIGILILLAIIYIIWRIRRNSKP